MRYAIVLFFIFSCKSSDKNSQQAQGNSVNQESLSSTMEGGDINLQTPYAIILGPGFGRTPYYIGFLKAADVCKVKIGGVSGLGTGLLVARLYAFNKKTFEWNIFKFSDFPWWSTKDDTPKVIQKLEAESNKIYSESLETQIPILMPNLKSKLFEYKEISKLDGLDQHFYFPYLLQNPNKNFKNEIQYATYPVQEFHRLGFSKIVVIGLLKEFKTKSFSINVNDQVFTLLSTIEAMNDRSVVSPAYYLQPDLSGYSLVDSMRKNYGQLKEKGLLDGVKFFRNQNFECENK